jgi:hypothetical protein
MADYVAKNQREHSAFVSVTEAPRYLLETLYEMKFEAANRAERKVSVFIYRHLESPLNWLVISQIFGLLFCFRRTALNAMRGTKIRAFNPFETKVNALKALDAFEPFLKGGDFYRACCTFIAGWVRRARVKSKEGEEVHTLIDAPADLAATLSMKMDKDSLMLSNPPPWTGTA